MTRLLICDLGNPSCPLPFNRISRLSRSCVALINYARNENWAIGHVYADQDHTRNSLQGYQHKVNEPIFSAKLSSIFSYYPLEVFCTEKSYEPVHLVGIIDNATLQASLEEAQVLGVNLVVSPNTIIVYNKSNEIESAYNSSRQRYHPPKRQAQGTLAKPPKSNLSNTQQERITKSIETANGCTLSLKRAIRALQDNPLDTEEENQEFHKAMQIAQLEILRWKTSLSAYLKPSQFPKFDRDDP